LLQSGGDAGVDEVVAVLELQTAKDCRVHLERQADVLAQALGQLGRDAAAIVRC